MGFQIEVVSSSGRLWGEAQLQQEVHIVGKFLVASLIFFNFYEHQKEVHGKILYFYL